MSQFTKIWAVKSDTPANPGDEILVKLKSGDTRKVRVITSLPQADGTFIHIPETKTGNHT